MQSGQPQKFCKWCASAVAYDAVVCPSCGRQIEELKQSQPNMGMNMGQPQVVINNNNNNGIPYGYMPEPYGTKDKGLALLLCLFGGFLGLHKFYEGKIGMGILYLLTGGLCAIGAIVDFFVLLGKPKKYLP
ncbi:MAG: TM2 domain-containing protein [Ruminococcus sp.]|nr:TM2 domain-containing protein [Ruminococcus sp.]